MKSSSDNTHRIQIYMLDEPFTQLDEQVARKIITNLFSNGGILDNKTVLLTCSNESLKIFLSCINKIKINILLVSNGVVYPYKTDYSDSLKRKDINFDENIKILEPYIMIIQKFK